VEAKNDIIRTGLGQCIAAMYAAELCNQQAQVRMQLANTLQGVMCQQLLPRVADKGRVLAYEVLIATPAVRALIRDGKMQQVPNVISTGREEGMMLMDRCIRALYESGIISYDTALSRCQDPTTFKMLGGMEAQPQVRP